MASPERNDNTSSISAGKQKAQRLKERYGEDVFGKLAKRGGDAVAAKMAGTDFFKVIGRKGGETTRARNDRGFYVEMGRKGGNALMRKYGPDYYSRIRGKNSGRRRRES